MPSWLPSQLSLPGDSDLANFTDVRIEVDALRLPREEYIARFGFRWVTFCTEIIAHGVHLDKRFVKELDSLIDTVPDDTWLTVAEVHA